MFYRTNISLTASIGMPHGAIVGTASNGVVGYNCNYKQIAEADYDHLNYVVDARGKLQYSGDKWQCVEYARRSWISQLDLYLPNVPRACDIWERKFVKRLSDGARVGLQMLTSGVTTHRPAVNDFIIWKKTDEQPVGHIAVVSEVTDEYVRIAEQNADNDQPWSGGHFARQFPLTCDASSGAWTMHDLEDPLFGWVRANFADVAAALPWQAPDEDRTSVDGDYGSLSVAMIKVFAFHPFIARRSLPISHY
jgi:glutathionylspermidine amidase/synthetase